MIKKRLAAVAVALMLGGLLLAPAERASAHDVFSGFAAPSTGGTFFTHFSHLTAPRTRSAMAHVGWDPSGFWIGTTTTVSMSNASYQLKAQDFCTNGAFLDSGWWPVVGPNVWIRGSGCSGFGLGLSTGQGGIRP